jgi:predicted TIM-barrel fold metal-dependent hydrolase
MEQLQPHAGPLGRTAGRSALAAHRIDLHSHFLPPDYRAHLIAHGQAAPEWSVAAQLEFMDAWGIQKSVVSAPQYFHFGDLAETRAVARAVNDAGRALLDAHGERFAVHATLPLPDVSASIAELSYAFDTLQLDGGVMLFTQYEGTYLGDPAYEGLYADLDRRGSVVWVHPSFPQEDPVGPFADHVPEFPFETTRAATTIIYKGLLERYPNIRWQLSHAGGTLPFLLTHSAFGQELPYCSDLAAEPQGPFAAARRFFYDTALGASEEQLLALEHLTGSPGIVFGTDWPFTDWMFAPDARRRAPWFSDVLPADGDPEPALSRAFAGPECLSIERENALALYPDLIRNPRQTDRVAPTRDREIHDVSR